MSLSPPFPPPQQPELLDPTASAGSLWRASRLAAFRDRAARSGLLPPPLSGDDGAGAVTTKSAAPETAADADADDGKTAAAASEEVASLLARAAELSSELDALASRQAKGKVQVPWWADGEYDDAAADAANDRGVEALRRWKREEAEERRRKKKSSAGASSVPSPPPPPPPPHASSSSSLFFAEQALALFTEAVRLRPSSAVYCANRSRAALASGRAETAAAAAAEAARADPACPRAWSLHGRALSSLGRIGEAVASFEKALKLEERGCGRAEGEAAAAAKCRLEAARASEAVANAAAASGNGGGARPALPRETAASEFERLQRDAGDAVEAAERALRAQPGRHELLRARAEVKRRKNVLDFISTLILNFLGLLKKILKLKKKLSKKALILSSRLSEASEAAQKLLPGPDRTYLLAEVDWRSGNVEAAVEKLEDFFLGCEEEEEGEGEGEAKRRRQHAAAADLCSFLRERLLPRMEGRGRERGIVAADSALAALPCRLAAPGLAARLLVERGRGRRERGEEPPAAAEADALEALRLVPGHRGALRLLGEAASASASAATKSSGEDPSEAADRAFLAFRRLHRSFEGGAEGVEGSAAAAAAATAAAAAAAAARASRERRAPAPSRRRHSPPPGLRGDRSNALSPPLGGVDAALRELRLPRSPGGPSGGAPPAAAVRAAFLSRASRCHPDKRRGSEGWGDGEEFVRAHRAYRLLMGVASSSEG